MLPIAQLTTTLFLMVLSPAVSDETRADEISCSMYSGDRSESGLRDQETRWQESIQQDPDKAAPHCQLAHIYFIKAANARGSVRGDFYHQCKDQANLAIQKEPKQSAAAFFLKGLCLGKLGEVEGIWSSLGIVDSFRESMEGALKLDPSVDRAGPHRALGRYYFKLPFFMGGSNEKALQHLEKAVAMAPEYWENHLFLAEVYLDEKITTVRVPHLKPCCD